MKKLVAILTIICFFISCKKDKECCAVIEAFADISVIEKSTNKDLLNPATANNYDILKINLAFSGFPNQKMSIAAIQTNKPVFFIKDGIYYLRVFSTSTEQLADVHTVIVHWNDTDSDKIIFHLSHSNGNILTEKILINDELKWDRAKGYQEITILK